MEVSVPFSSYESTRLGIDSQKRINLYDHSDGGLRQYPGLSEFGNIASSAALIDSYDFTTEKSYAQGIFVSEDGKHLFIGSTNGAQEDVRQYELTVPFDISASSIVDTTNTYDVSTTTGSPIYSTSHIYLTPRWIATSVLSTW